MNNIELAVYRLFFLICTLVKEGPKSASTARNSLMLLLQNKNINDAAAVLRWFHCQQKNQADASINPVLRKVRKSQDYINDMAVLGDGPAILFHEGTALVDTRLNRKGNLYVGEFSQWHPDGTLKASGHLNENGDLEGLFYTYNEMGSLIAKYTFKDNKLNGEARLFWPNETLQAIRHYQDDKPVGDIDEWYEAGHLKYTLRTTVTPSGFVGAEETHYFKDVPEGAVSKKVILVGGKEENSYEYDKAGNVIRTVSCFHPLYKEKEPE